MFIAFWARIKIDDLQMIKVLFGLQRTGVFKLLKFMSKLSQLTIFFY